MNNCIKCDQCADTGCLCPATVAKAKPVDGGNVWFAAPEPEPIGRLDALLMAAIIGVAGGFCYGVVMYFFGG